MTKPQTTWLAVGLLISIAVLAFTSSRGDSAIVDEVPHLAAGYSYVTRADMRLNPEHPPLVKDLAGLALWAWSDASGTPLTFPDDHFAWRDETNGQWTIGSEFLYHRNSHSATMLQWSRLPTLLIFVAFGLWFFIWLRRRYGPVVAGLALFFYACSPTVIAHARFVTTDLAAAAAFFTSVAAWLWWLARPTWRRTILFGLVLGAAQLVKFSLLLLIPLFPVMQSLFTLVAPGTDSIRQRGFVLVRQLIRYLVALTVALGLVVTPMYILHTWRYPVERQKVDVVSWSPNMENEPLADFVRWSVDKPIIRAVGHYVTGLLLVQNRSHFGSRTSFLGTVDNVGRTWYFPIVYLTKEPLPLHILSVVALGIAGLVAFHRRRSWRQVGGWVDGHRAECAAIAVIGWYWWTSMHSELNIGVRHVLPTFPFIFFLVARMIVWSFDRLRRSGRRLFRPSLALLGALLGWQLVSVIGSYPSFLGYYNALAGGPERGASIATDSNLDWGQDLKRLASFVRQRGITSIHVDYFGGGDLRTEIPGAGLEYHVDDGPVTGWLAVSRTYWTNETSRKGAGIPPGPNRYAWLEPYEPVAVIGHSIDVYYIPEPSGG